MSENAQATSVAGAPAARNGGTGAAKRSGKGGRGLTVGIAVGAVLTVVGIALWAVQLSGGMAQTAMRNLDSWGLYITMLHVLRGALRRRPHHLERAARLRHQGLRRHLQGGRVDVRLLHGAGHRLRGGGPGPAPASVGAVRVLQPGKPPHVGHHRAGGVPDPVGGVPVGDAAPRGGEGVGRGPARGERDRARVRGAWCTP